MTSAAGRLVGALVTIGVGLLTVAAILVLAALTVASVAAVVLVAWLVASHLVDAFWWRVAATFGLLVILGGVTRASRGA